MCLLAGDQSSCVPTYATGSLWVELSLSQAPGQGARLPLRGLGEGCCSPGSPAHSAWTTVHPVQTLPSAEGIPGPEPQPCPPPQCPSTTTTYHPPPTRNLLAGQGKAVGRGVLGPGVYEGPQKRKRRSTPCGSEVTNLTSTHENMGSIPGLAQWVKDPVLP